MPTSHPILTKLTIKAVDLHRLCLCSSQTVDYNLIGYDDGQDGLITAHIACVSDQVARLLEEVWA